jgi:hypothetical protein
LQSKYFRTHIPRCCIVIFGSLSSRNKQLSNFCQHVRYKSVNTSLLDLMTASKHQHGFIHNISDLTLHIMFDGWWASLHVSRKQPSAWNTSRHAASWQFYLHCRIEATGTPGIICIMCYHVLLHPPDHGTSSMGKPLLAKAHITKKNKFTMSEIIELTSSTVDEAVSAILIRQRSRGITTLSVPRKTIFEIQLNPY